MKKEQTYQQAIDALEAIITQLENGSLSVDELSTQIKEAGALITFCKNKLHETDENINKIFSQIED
ncbi:MAG: exodeoxyribonuclease VII small subunit [Paludibacteraceae bacterium]|jgi:exodeoxyribonuclease VII small subunit|nr:exodeoxyribonuclease VII small subunit [Paludibacteraceae bacterium]